ncbi:MAG: ATP-dependent helicase [bacterium]|jgi:DNA helicase-2/ATP-dependent DNA helicase PcrA|tara:strand:- start:1058 stop:3079 length:2022 start_codon:yes stop_codon:yes gene_type:complete
MSTWSIASLNPVQRKIVEHKTGPALVIAGAGSGKTRVITHRVAQLIHSGIPASSILLLTFTNKAANEMAQRVGRALKNSTEQQKIIHGTFHSVGSRFLRRNAKLLNYNNNFSILDSSDSRELIKASLAETVGKPGKYFPKAAVLQNMFSLAFNRFCTQKMILDQPYHERSFHLEQLISADFPNFEENTETILNILAAYRHKKKRGQVMDFDDLLENWLELLLRHGEGLPLCQQIQYILVDEYQDTNQVQANILYRLSRPHKNLMVVGDDAQSIYSWRGADFGNMLEFPERYQAVTYNMEENYRSSPEILDAANRSINYNTRQFEKNLFSSLAEGEKPLVHYVWAAQDEAELVLENILSFREKDIPLNEMSVLYRNHVQSAALQLVLTHAGIPFVVHSGVKFFEQAHIKDVTAFLKVLFNPLDEIAWMRLLRLLPGIGNTTAHQIFRVFQSQQAVRLTKDNVELQKLIPKKALESWNVLLEIFQQMLEENVTPSHMIGLLYKSYYREVLFSSFENAPQRETDIRYLEEFAGNYNKLEAFLNELSLVGSSIITDHEAEQQDNQDTLTLTTIHQAKGLEWKVVFIIGLTEGLFPHQRSLGTEEQIEEERRLFYVAMTRAKRHLLITAPVVSSGYSGGISKRSRFINELAEETINTEIHTRDEYSYGSRGGQTQFYF